MVNIQAATSAHLDSGDKSIYIVMPFGEFEEGELVLFEAGLVVDMKEGTIVAFPSFYLMHFNLHFWGFRGSVVFQSDKNGDSWVKDRNGWDSHMVI